jgi:nifR3 family TIM-barrel protein
MTDHPYNEMPRSDDNQSLFRPVAVGGRGLPGNLALAPMAGATDGVFRAICREQGASLTCTELVSARGIRHDPGWARSWRYLAITPAEQPVAIQLFGADPDDFDYAVRAVLEHPVLSSAFAIDINMGCPVPKVVGTGAGSALMRDLPLAARVIRSAVAAASGYEVPVTVKFRTGWDAATADTPAFARMAEQSGAAMLMVHARTRDMMYAGQADWSVIARVKAAVSVPVFGNGDVRDGPSAVAMLRETGADGAAIGRGALGNPWVFAHAAAALRGEAPLPPPDVAARAQTALREVRERAANLGEARGVRESRKSLLWYLHGTPRAAETRRRAAVVESLKEVERLLADWESSFFDKNGAVHFT